MTIRRGNPAEPKKNGFNVYKAAGHPLVYHIIMKNFNTPFCRVTEEAFETTMTRQHNINKISEE